MKHRINRKGFSLPMSMLFMLVVIMLTMVLLSAALAAAKQVNQKKLDKQAELNVTSTAEVLSNALIDMTFKQETGDAGTTVSVVDDNGNATLAAAMGNWIQTAENSAANYYQLKGSDALTIEEGSCKVEATVIVYSSKSAIYPGDIVISLTDKSASTTGYTQAFRLDGKLDTGNGSYQFSDMTFYSGSEVY